MYGFDRECIRPIPSATYLTLTMGGRIARRYRRASIALSLLGIVTALCVAPAASAKGKPSGGGSSGGSSCVAGAPRVVIDNNYAWSSPGTWGLPGQRLAYAIHVMNNDVGCGSSTFTISVSVPSGFSVSVPTSTISLGSSSSGYLWAYVTSPTSVADGDYPVAVDVMRAGDAASAGMTTNYYKVYSADGAPPTLFWANPWNGQAISGKSFMVTVSSSDDHAVEQIDLAIDGVRLATTACDDVTYTCQLSYKWSVSRAPGLHTATFTSTDWTGNVGSMSVSFTVG
jgi:hypothetical protein